MDLTMEPPTTLATHTASMDVPRAVQKKVEKAIERDRWKKVAKLVSRGELGVDSVVGRRGERMVHLAAREEAGDCMEWLVGRGADARLLDRYILIRLSQSAVLADRRG